MSAQQEEKCGTCTWAVWDKSGLKGECKYDVEAYGLPACITIFDWQRVTYPEMYLNSCPVWQGKDSE